MKCIDLINELKSLAAYEVDEEKTCDTVKAGDTEKELNKVCFSMFATPDVIKKAKTLGAQLLVVHEPTFYNHMDNEIPYKIAELKRKFVEESGICIFRFHDYAHLAEPDIIYDGTVSMLGLKGKRVNGEKSGEKRFGINQFILDEEITPRELAKLIEDKLGLKNVRIAGAADSKCRKLSCCFGTPGGLEKQLEENDIVLAGEICEWGVGEMARDYALLGCSKAIIVMGHIGSERSGMMKLAEMVKNIHPELNPEYIECSELYQYTK